MWHHICKSKPLRTYSRPFSMMIAVAHFLFLIVMLCCCWLLYRDRYTRKETPASNNEDTFTGEVLDKSNSRRQTQSCSCFEKCKRQSCVFLSLHEKYTWSSGKSLLRRNVNRHLKPARGSSLTTQLAFSFNPAQSNSQLISMVTSMREL